MVGEAVTHIAQLATLNVLLDGVEEFFLGNLHLCIGPAGDLDDHVEDGVISEVGEELDVVPWRDDRLLAGDWVLLLRESTEVC